MRGLGLAHAQAVVEFALVLPLLLFLLVGLIELGIVLQAQIILTNAAWEGARAGRASRRLAYTMLVLLLWLDRHRVAFG